METVFTHAKLMVLGLEMNQFVRASGRDKNSVKISSRFLEPRFQIKMMFGFEVIVQVYCHSSSYYEGIVEIESYLMSILIVLIYPCSC